MPRRGSPRPRGGVFQNLFGSRGPAGAGCRPTYKRRAIVPPGRGLPHHRRELGGSETAILDAAVGCSLCLDSDDVDPASRPTPPRVNQHPRGRVPECTFCPRRCGRRLLGPRRTCDGDRRSPELAVVYAASEESSFALTSRCRPIAPSAASIRSSRERCRTSRTRSTCGRCHPRRRASSALPIPCSRMP